MKRLLLALLLAVSSASATEIAFSSLYMLNDDYPNIGDITEPSNFGGVVIPFKTGSGQYTVDYLALEHLSIFDGEPFTGRVTVQLFQNNNPLGSFPSPTGNSAFLGDLPFAGNDPRDTLFPGWTVFERFEPTSGLTLTGNSHYFFYVNSDPEIFTSMLFHRPWTPDFTANLPGWQFTRHRTGSGFSSFEDLVFELGVSRVPDGASSGCILMLGCAALMAARRALGRG